MSATPIQFRPRISAEDEGRASFYALIASLLLGPPSAGLLKAIGQAAPLDSSADDFGLALAWSQLIAVSGVMDEEAAREEYVSLFGGVADPLIKLYATHYWNAAGIDGEIAGRHPLVALRNSLAELGLGRLETQDVYEDHLGALCEILRVLILGVEDRPPATVDVQRKFFANHVAWCFAPCCNAISETPIANYYRVVANFAHAFLSVDGQSLAIDA